MYNLSLALLIRCRTMYFDYSFRGTKYSSYSLSGTMYFGYSLSGTKYVVT